MMTIWFGVSPFPKKTPKKHICIHTITSEVCKHVFTLLGSWFLPLYSICFYPEIK
ncbi:hypothetical protein KUCAC02_019898 [Chaenocephalus aceratus]|uniref:Uncharacterized protein n=1 Tax=Chaenocephalus aceratus TaxID=36190 RepID=A0ACB9VPW2_CHAAC|nr:hypothetical protein KUCAC02_019898 [Chaenocephalus aceratus]